MRLVRFGKPGHERPGLFDAQGNLRDLSAHVEDWRGASLDPETLSRIRAIRIEELPKIAATERLGPPVGGVGKIIGVGLNYADHAKEAGLTAPTEPLWFLKASSSLSGPHDPIRRPRGALKLDWEVELAVVIGRKASYVSESAAPDHIAGYAVFNDVSERSFQLERGTQWTKGKSCDSFAPLGPWLVTTDEIPEPGKLEVWLEVNGKRMQHSSTANLIFSISALIASLSSYMTLHPGDVIATGTPGGVGLGRKPQEFLNDGDVVELGIAGLGRQRQEVVKSE
jgi:2-keto-4-pentenoate hydratase/2-oxohepta-3-ene-1,7-dioic acid hydratase in catechol pathway